ncbi:MAG: flagellar biosynthetic protein FliR [Planctomycetia bacterium]|nr:flagellar biosynthetic protein FliR [Planctomycetia bacterium]
MIPAVATFIFVLARLTGMLMLAPMFAGKWVPVRFRVALAFVVAVLVTMNLWTPTAITSWVELGVKAAGEAFLGMALGAMVLLFFTAMQVAGGVIAYTSGLSFPVDGGISNEAASLFSEFFMVLGIAVVFLTNGHHLVLEAVLESFATFPPGEGVVGPDLLRTVFDLFSTGFALGVRIALPVLTILLVSQLGMAILSRILPQLNTFSLSFAVNALLVLLVLSLSLGTGLWVFEEEFSRLF